MAFHSFIAGKKIHIAIGGGMSYMYGGVNIGWGSVDRIDFLFCFGVEVELLCLFPVFGYLPFNLRGPVFYVFE